MAIAVAATVAEGRLARLLLASTRRSDRLRSQTPGAVLSSRSDGARAATWDVGHLQRGPTLEAMLAANEKTRTKLPG